MTWLTFGVSASSFAANMAVCESREVHPISDAESYTKTLGLEWNVKTDTFRLTVANHPSSKNVTKRMLVSDVVKVFDVLGWFAPATVHMKILLQRLWEQKSDWDDPVPAGIGELWTRWRKELPTLASKSIHFPREAKVTSMQIHGFSDASEDAYASVVYVRLVSLSGSIYTSLVMSKTKVSPIKRISIPRLELCGAHLLAQLLQHVKDVFHLPMTNIFAWTDSTVVLAWLTGSSRRLKTYVSNRVYAIVDQIPPDRWNHVPGTNNPADRASRGLFPLELLDHELWWKGPAWLKCVASEWPKREDLTVDTPPEEEREIALVTASQPEESVIPFLRYLTFTQFQRVAAWILHFVHNCRTDRESATHRGTPTLTVVELAAAERYWMALSQHGHFLAEWAALRAKQHLPKSGCLTSLNPFLDSEGLLRIGGRESHSNLSFSR